MVLKCLDDGYLEFVRNQDDKYYALVSLANKMGSDLVNDAEEAVTIIDRLLL